MNTVTNVSYTTVLGDAGPVLALTLQANGAPFALDAVNDSAALNYLGPDGITRTVALTIVSASNGTVSRTWTSGDLPVRGAYHAQVVVTRAGNTLLFPQTFPNDGTTVTWVVNTSFGTGLTPPVTGAAYYPIQSLGANPAPPLTPNYLWLNNGVASMTVGGVTTAIGSGGGGGNSSVIDVTSGPYNADKTGVTDATSAIQTALTAAIAAGKNLYFPRGTYKVTNAGNYLGQLYCLLVPTVTGLKLIGDNATITFPSQSTNCIVFATTVANITVDGLAFQGANDDAWVTNTGAALYGWSFDLDFTITRCTFQKSFAVVFGSDGPAPGRMILTHNRILNCTQGFSIPYRGIIANNIFDCDTQPGTRSHHIYIYGAAGDVVITGNVFRRSDVTAGTYAIQFRAGAARFNYKHGVNITGNTFVECGGAMWIGSDDANGVAEALVSSNTFFNCAACVYVYGLRNGNVSNNVAEYSWEFTNGGSAAFNSTYVSGTNNATTIKFDNNSVVNQHPYYGTITVNTLPAAGDTLTVGTQVYTFRATAGATGEITIGPDIATCALNIAAALRGDSFNKYNAVLRTPQDSMVSQFSYDASATNVVVIVSFATFALTSASSHLTVTSVVDHHAPIAAGMLVDRTFGARITNNTFTDVAVGLQVSDCMEPIIENNTSLGCQFVGLHNVKSVWRNNAFTLTPTREALYPRPDRWLSVDDGFPIIYGNLGTGVGQQYGDAQGGAQGVVTVGDGKAKVWFYYGVENLSGGSGQASTLPWRWDNGDTVAFSDQVSHAVTFTFQRTSPGALQFNSAASLLTLINATGWLAAAFIATTDTGSDTPPNTMIEIKYNTVGTAGNVTYVQVVRAAANGSGADSKSTRMCGVILLNRKQGVDANNYCYFLGGAASATKTAVFTPAANNMRGAWVQGIDSTSNALVPVVYQANIAPGVGFEISHSVAAGIEKFFVRAQ